MDAEEKSQLLVDEEGGLQRLGGDREIYNELMELFMDNATSLIEQLKEAVRNNEASSIEHIAHSIKGAAANLGVIQVQQCAYELEKIGNQKRVEQAGDSFSKLAYEFERVKNYWQS